jgi:hypothetical protein
MINIDWMTNDRSQTKGGWSFEDELVSNKFKSNVIKLVHSYSPDRITLGTEINYYALNYSGGYRAFVNCFNDLKEKIYEVNPTIKVGLSFQLELLYGNHLEWEKNKTLETLDAVVPNLDYLALSTYPEQYEATTVDTNGLKYIDSICNRYKLPIGISETGISNLIPQSDRADYIKSIFKKVRSNQLEYIIWGAMIDHSGEDMWHHQLGLLNVDGSMKPDFNIWKNESETIKKNRWNFAY